MRIDLQWGRPQVGTPNGCPTKDQARDHLDGFLSFSNIEETMTTSSEVPRWMQVDNTCMFVPDWPQSVGSVWFGMVRLS